MTNASITSVGNLYSSNFISYAGGVYYLQNGKFKDMYSYFV